MTISAEWTPVLEEHDGPLYLAIADALARDVAAGTLPAGARLPTHRDLAERCKVNVGTVTRAYAEAARRGLVEGEVGRGTYVRPQDRWGPLPQRGGQGVVDLGFNVPAGGVDVERATSTLRELESADLHSLFDVYHLRGVEGHRRAGASWIGRTGLAVDPARVLVTGGAQHAMSVVLATVARAGDVVATEELTYPGMKTLSAALGLRMHPVAMDEHGLRPDAFEEACRSASVRVLYTMPTVQNPTGTVLPEDRRREITNIARRHGVTIVEDDTYGFLAEDAPPPLAHFAPELTYFVTSTSKSVAAGLRVGWVLAPLPASPRQNVYERLVAAIGALGWMTPPLTAEISARWIADGTADEAVRARRTEARARRKILREVLGDQGCPSYAGSCHVWWSLPEPWRANEFAEEAEKRGVVITPPEAFAVGRRVTPHAVRICSGTPRTREELRSGLEILAELARGAQPVGSSIL